MLKKFICGLISIVMAVMLLVGAVNAFAEENTINAGDELQVIFTIGEVQNVSGVSMTAEYNSEYLKAKDIVCNVSGSEKNINIPGGIRWNFLVYNGMNFNNDDVVIVTFEALKTCTVDMIGLSYDCTEFFNPDIKPISDAPNDFFAVKAVHNGSEYTVHEAGWTDNIINDSDTDTSETDKNKTYSNNDNQNTNTNTNTNTVTAKSLSNNNNAVARSMTVYLNASGAAVDTSSSYYVTVIILLSLLVLSGATVIILNKKLY